MAKSLVIVESPAKARTIGRYLGGQYEVRASLGHVRDLPESDFGVDVAHDFEPTYRILPKKRKTVAQLKKAAKAAGAVYLATDLDREGEAIAWHLCHALGVPESEARRVIFNQITAAAVRAAFEHPQRLDLNKVNAQQARRILDRIVGYELSPLLWRLVTKGLSAGRVQSVAVRLVVEREREIAAFVPVEYWKITATLAPTGAAQDESQHFTALLVEWQGKKFEAKQGDEARAVAQALSRAAYAVTALKVDQRSEAPPPPFTTSTLQQSASTQLRMNTRRTMRIAQQLYEGLSLKHEGEVGLITYMRTDSVQVAPEAVAAARDLIGRSFGPQYLPPQPRPFKQRAGAQAAHEAIRPTDLNRTPDSLKDDLDRDQHRLYELIWKRFVASQMTEARYENTSARITADAGVFEAKGRRLLFDGFRRVAGLASTEDQLLPALAEGQALDLVKLEPSRHFTEPPPRYSEASLVRALEREGIGRPSTYAPIIATIQDRDYVRLEKRRFHATELGMLVTDLLVKHFERVMDLGFTRFMESELDRIEDQGQDWVRVLREFYEPFKAALDSVKTQVKDIKREISAIEDQKCPKCGKPLAQRWSKFGRFIGCTGYPECDYTQRLGGNGEPETLDETCPECGKPLAYRRSKFGRFIGCTGYPACRYIKKGNRGGSPANGEEAPAAAPADGPAAEHPPAKSARQAQAEAAFADAPEPAKAKVSAPEPTAPATVPPCEKCGSPMVERRSRRGPFLGCSAYPKCRNTRPLGGDELAKEAEGVTCPTCQGPMVVRRSRHGPFLGCARYPACKGTRPLDRKKDAEGEERPRKKREPKRTGVKCPRPGCDGELVARRGRSGTFYGCSRFPECTHTANELPAGGEGE